MNKVLTVAAIALMAMFSSNAMAQCVGCAGGVTPSFSQPVMQSAPVYSAAPTYSTPVYTPTFTTPVSGTPLVTSAQPTTGARTIIRRIYVIQPVIVRGQAMSGCSGCSSQPVMMSQPVIYRTHIQSSGCCESVVAKPAMTYQASNAASTGSVLGGGETVINETVVNDGAAASIIQADATPKPSKQAPAPEADNSTPPSQDTDADKTST